jgi:FecR protein.
MRFSRSDAAASAALLVGAAALVALFLADLGSSAARSGERQLGEVVFKRLAATRKAPGSLGWERMRNESPVYDADTLRTADLSEASIYFDDGTSLDMLENTMLKLDLGGKAKSLQFLGGEISVGSSSEATSYAISSTAGTISVAKGARATFSREADSLSVELSRGTASLVGKDGSSLAITQGQELRVDVKSGVAALVDRPIVPVAPERNTRLLSFAGKGKAAVDFAWMPQAGAPDRRAAPAREEYTIELSKAPSFEEIAAQAASSGREARIELAAGEWYWRVVDAAGRASPTRRFSLDIAEPPRPAYPPDGQAYAYRRVKPAIGFAWSATAEDASYLFEVASDPGFAKPTLRSRTTLRSLYVDSLGEGTWYWRVSPVHAAAVVGEPPAIQVRSLVISKSPAMVAPLPASPLGGTMYQVQELDAKGISFSWLPRDEAVSYELLIADRKDLTSPLATIPASRSFVSLSGSQAEVFRRPGAYYWGLRWIDKEGNASPTSEARGLVGVDGSIALRPSFPPDGYRVADSLVANARFAWKSNVKARTVFQLGRDRSFAEIAYQEAVSADTILGHDWKSGRYYWRLRSYNVDGSVFLDSEARSLDVVEPFESPVLVRPSPGSRVYLREGDSLLFSWSAVPGADYYTAALSPADSPGGRPVLEKSFIEGTSLGYELGALPSGNYKLSLQAFASSGENTTRIIGYSGESSIDYRKVHPLEPASPAEGERVGGLEARKGKVVFSYEAEYPPDSAEVLVSRDEEGSRVVARAEATSGRASVGRLDPGVYYWTVAGSLAGLDISARRSLRFEVETPPPPPATRLTGPADGFLYRLKDFKAEGLKLSWEPEAEAASYELLLSTRKDLSSPIAALATDTSSLRLSTKEVEALGLAGTYYWGVRWRNAEGDLSLASESRALAGTDEEAAFGLAFPPEGYRIADDLIAGARFSWKTALPTRVDFQLSREPSFKDPVYQEIASFESIKAETWKAGRYYWRLRSYNVDGSVFIDSEPRSFEIVEPLAAPSLLSPAPGSSLELREGDAATFAWAPVPGADYYAASLRSSADGYSSSILETRVRGKTSFSYALGDLPSGSYTLVLQAFSEAQEAATRIVGRRGEGSFAFERLTYVALDGPAREAHLPGLEARRGQVSFSYSASAEPDAAEVLVASDAACSAIVSRAAGRGGKAIMGRLDPGVYYWTVSARRSGLDLSSKERRRLVVDEIPPLPAPELVEPAANAVVGAAQLRQKRGITLSWKPVEGATAYRVAVFAAGRAEPLLSRSVQGRTELAIDDLSAFDRGQFSWVVAAAAYDPSGELERRGLEARAAFAIDLPSMKNAKPSTGEKSYGH